MVPLLKMKRQSFALNAEQSYKITMLFILRIKNGDDSLKKTTDYILLTLTYVVVLLATLIVFFVGFGFNKKSSVDYAALIFVLVSEVSLFLGTALACISSRNKLFVRAGVFSTLSLYWLITTLISIFYKSIFGQGLNGLITIQIIVFALAAIIITGILLASGIITNNNGNESVLQSCENTIFLLKNDQRLKNYSHQFDELYETLKYSDRTTVVSNVENEIKGKLNELCSLLSDCKQQDSANEIAEKINEVVLLIKQRNQLAAQLKKGVF